MTIEIIIKTSHLQNKKYDAVIDDKKTIPFGARGMSDYTIHRDDERKERYINRHKKNEDWDNIYTAGFGRKIFFGTRKQLQNQLKIQIINLKI